MKVSKASLAWLLVSLMLGACGYRGPLYLPGQEPVKKTRRAPPPAQPPAPQPATQAPAGNAPVDQPQSPTRVDR